MSRVSPEEFASWLEGMGHDVRTATVNASASTVSNYLPSNYQVTSDNGDHVIVKGVDIAGWTLEGYVIPRLASGLIFAKEVK